MGVQKYIFDRVLSAVALAGLFPLFVIIAIAIKVSSQGPVFFRQPRIGRKGRSFTIIKFRTMVTTDDCNPITTANDARITKVGSFLRKWKLDELPELINILFADMSFVGPRPDVRGYADLLTGKNREILSLYPGLTGPASLKYHDEERLLAEVANPREYNDNVIFPDKVKINVEYLRQNSLIGDIKIIVKTISTILRGKNDS